MGRFYQLLTLVFFIAAMTGATAGIARAGVSVYPNGLHGPSDIVSGIDPGTDSGNCCWLRSQGAFKMTAPAGANTMLLDVYVPNFAAPAGGQALTVWIGNAKAKRFCCFGAGAHEFSIRIPQRARSGVDIVHLRAGRTFVPKRIGINDDTRQLSVLVRGISFMNAATGAQIQAATPWLSQLATLRLLTMAGVAVLLVTLKRPIYGVVALVVTDPFLLTYDIHGTTITLPKVTLIAVALALLPRLRQLGHERPWRAVAVLGIAQILFMATMIAASVHAAFHGAAARETLKAAEFLLVLVVAYCAYRLDPQELEVRVSLAVLTIVVAVAAAAQLLLGSVQAEVIAGHTIPRLAGPLEGPNQLAGFLSMAVPAMLAFALLRGPLLLERLAIAFGAAACLFTFSRGGIGALAVTVAVLIALRYRPSWRTAVGGAVGAAFAIAFFVAFGVFSGVLHGRVESIFGSGETNGGLGTRTDLWHGAYTIWRSRPLFGIGPGNFEFAIGRIDPGVRTHANSMYFQVLAEQGIVGFIALLGLVAASVLTFARRLNEPLTLAACMAALAMNLHQIVDCMWIFDKVGVFWWILLALGAAALDLQTAADRVPEAAVAQVFG